jgi:2-phosphosulfolactate phosphatase
VIAGCLRNRSAAAAAASSFGRPIAVVAAGERWPDGSLRPAIEDLVGAGAIISQLNGSLSPEAQLAARTFESSRELAVMLACCSSGRELALRSFGADVSMAAALDSDLHAPTLGAGAFAR